MAAKQVPAYEVEVLLVREKETKNTIRYAEAGPEDQHQLGILYVPKKTVSILGNPEEIVLTVRAA